MKPILYPQDDDQTGLGYGYLSDCTRCIVTEERNGIYEAEIDYPITGLHYDDITLENIIRVKPNPFTAPQPFRIYEISRPINGIVTVYARHKSYDLSGIPVEPFADVIGCTAALNALVTHSIGQNDFTVWTDIANTKTYSHREPKSFRACLGGVAGSILDEYGGEYEFDETTVKLWTNRGTNRGVIIRYGKNLTSLRQQELCDSVYSTVYPYYYQLDPTTQAETLVELPERVLPVTDNPSMDRCLMLNATADFTEPPTEAQLRAWALSYIDSHELAVPEVSLDVEFAPLRGSDDYQNVALLEDVRLCDTVTILFEELGVNATAKCIKTGFNALTEKYERISLGSARASLADTIRQNARTAEAAPQTALKFAGEMIQMATQAITGNLGGNVVLHDADGDSRPEEILIMDSDDIQTAQRVWRWNAGGLGYSDNGYAGTYQTAITADGAIVGDFVSTGTIGADVAFVGELRGVYGTFLSLLAGDEAAAHVSIGNTGGDPYIVMYDDNGDPAVSHTPDGTFYTNSVRLVKFVRGDKSGLAIFAR